MAEILRRLPQAGGQSTFLRMTESLDLVPTETDFAIQIGKIGIIAAL